MAQIDRWIGSNGDVLVPLNQNADNSAPMVSAKTGVYYFVQLHVTPPSPVTGNVIGIFPFTLTYA